MVSKEEIFKAGYKIGTIALITEVSRIIGIQYSAWNKEDDRLADEAYRKWEIEINE